MELRAKILANLTQKQLKLNKIIHLHFDICKSVF